MGLCYDKVTFGAEVTGIERPDPYTLIIMFDNVLQALRSSRLGRLGRGHVDQDREASSLFAGDFVGTTTIEAEFSRSILGLGVMDNLGGEVISLSGETWFVPQDGTPLVAAPEDTLAFGIAAHGGIAHYLPLEQGLDFEGINDALDRYLKDTHVDHEQVVCALKIEGNFHDVLLRTVGTPEYEGETLEEVIEAEARFAFEQWSGTLVGFRYPDASTGATIPGLHLHAISADRTSGGHLRGATLSQPVVAALWIDELHLRLENPGSLPAEPIDFDALEGPITGQQ